MKNFQSRTLSGIYQTYFSGRKIRFIWQGSAENYFDRGRQYAGQLLALPIPVVLLCFVVLGKCSNIFELVF